MSNTPDEQPKQTFDRDGSRIDYSKLPAKPIETDSEQGKTNICDCDGGWHVSVKDSVHGWHTVELYGIEALIAQREAAARREAEIKGINDRLWTLEQVEEELLNSSKLSALAFCREDYKKLEARLKALKGEK